MAKSLRLRATVAVELNGSQGWHDAFLKDPESSVAMEDGEPAVEPAAYVESAKRQNKWFDNYCCQAASNVLQSDIIIFKFVREEWHLMQTFTPTQKKTQQNPHAHVFEKMWRDLTLHYAASGPSDAGALERLG